MLVANFRQDRVLTGIGEAADKGADHNVPRLSSNGGRRRTK